VNRLQGVIAGLILAALASFIPVAAELPEGDADRGKRIYWEGKTAAGEAIPVTVRGDVEGTADNFSCVGCHRPSGFGGSEGGQFVPPITAPILFNERGADQDRRNRRFRDLFKEVQGDDFDARGRMPRMRPAYTEETLARAIREGKDPEGRDLSESMPRYELSDQQVADLIAYLKTLSAEKSPGVTDEVIHLATVVSEGVEPSRRKAVVDTFRAFADWFNKDIQAQIDHSGFSPFYRSQFKDSFRFWEPHVWELQGPPSTWGDQLRDYYEEQPVFAVVSGVVEGPWAPVDAFCDQRKLPCVFPNTDLPDTEDARYGYSIYFSRGLELEAEVLATFLGDGDSPETVHQIRADQPAGRIPAEAFRKTTEDRLPEATVSTARVASGEDWAERIEQAGEKVGDSDALVLWPGDHLQSALQALNAQAPGAGTISLPSTALDAAKEQLGEDLFARLRVIHPYEEPEGYHPRQFRIRAWFHSRKLDMPHPRIQLQTYYALTQMQFGIGHLVSDFYRDYLMEFIEHEAEAELNPGTHPSLSLGPGQRFASKGAFVVRLDPEAKDGYKPVTEWIVP